MSNHGPVAHCGGGGDGETPTVLLTAILMPVALCGSLRAFKNYYKMKHKGATWEPFRAEANACGSGGVTAL